MNRILKAVTVAVAVIISAFAVHTVWSGVISPAPNGIGFPEGYKDWRVIAPSHRTDKNHIRVIIGNEVAINAARKGRTNPWPDGSALGKLVWKDAADPAWPDATVPGDFVHAEFMFKDSNKYSATGGWGYARWVGMELKPYGSDANFAKECFNCHTPVKYNDYVFTHPAKLP
jgi:hypothetical protein